MKKIHLLYLLPLTWVTTAQNYTRQTPEEKARKYTLALLQEVQLDSAQTDKVYAINVQVSKQFDSLYASRPDDLLKKKTTIQILRRRDSLYRTVFSPEQFLQYDDIQREKREKKRREQEEKQKMESKEK
ncbi:MAG: hypothetical protein RIQ62_42 [Bacteroidota bacterium]|jgi:hypothetical protein